MGAERLYLYRNSNPEDRRVGPESVNGRKKFKVVYVVLESQYQSSMTVACKRINAVQVLDFINLSNLLCIYLCFFAFHRV